MSTVRNWFTTVTNSKKDLEQRAALKTNPIRGINYKVDAVDQSHSAYIYRKFLKDMHKLIGIPVWVDGCVVTGAITAGDTVLNVDSTDYMEYDTYEEFIIVGGFILDDWDTYEVIRVGSFTTTTMTLVGNGIIEGNWPVGSMIFPVMPSRLEMAQEVGVLTDYYSGIGIAAKESFGLQIFDTQVVTTTTATTTTGTTTTSTTTTTTSPYVDFTPYTKVDSGGDIAVTPHKVDVVSMLEDEVSWAVYDYGAGYLSGDFTQRLKGTFTLGTGPGTLGNVIWAWTSTSTGGFTIQDLVDNNDGFMLYFQHTSDPTYKINLHDFTTDITDDYDLGNSPPYTVYVEVERVSSTLTAKVYSNSDFTGLLVTLTVSCDTSDMRYHIAANSRERVGTNALTFSSENFNLNL